MSVSARRIALAVLLLALAGKGNAEGRKRALLIGINDYSASHLPAPPDARPAIGRKDWPDLNGAVIDVHALQELLTRVYDFPAGNVVILTDQEATRAAMVRAIDQLVASVSKDDVVFFYYAGHGSQVANSLSHEPDKRDESIVPADSRRGAPDIRDKELSVRFNRILDRGAHLTIMLDNCFSGSGARGLPTGAQPRAVRPDLRDVADPSRGAPRPENRGALVLAAAEDFQTAYETRDEHGVLHGAFTWAWLRSLRDAAGSESAMTIFLRTQGRMRAESPFQEPVIAGTSDTRLRSFLGTRVDRSEQRTVVAISRVRRDGTVTLQGGWVNGLSVGNELQVVNAPYLRFTITRIDGLGQSEARESLAARHSTTIKPGTLLEVVGWAVPPLQSLHVWIPAASRSVSALEAIARNLEARARSRRLQWVTDPLDVTPLYTLRWNHDRWELLGANAAIERVGSDAAAIERVAGLPTGSFLFVQFPLAEELVHALGVGPRTAREGIVFTSRADDADYVLTGRLAGRHLSYAWVRPGIRGSDRQKTGLPLRSDWIAPSQSGTTSLRDAVLRLRAIRGWQLLESPPEGRFPYHLDLRRQPDNELPQHATLAGGERYTLVLRSGPAPLPTNVRPRYLYVFALDSFGRSVLLYPPSGSVENRFPLESAPPPPEIALDATFEIEPPYGIDTYFLLTTDEPLPNPWILDSQGVRTRDVRTPTPLEQLLLQAATGVRGARIVTPSTWSIDRVVYESKAKR